MTPETRSVSVETTDTIRAADFLRAIFGEWERGYAVLWRGDTKRSSFLSAADMDSANEAAEEAQRTRGASLYFGCGLQGIVATDGGRGGAAGVCAIPGVWTDLDIAEGAGVKKSKKRYPPREVAEQLLAQMPLPPSLVMHSGGGLQTYWLFNDLLAIHTPGDRDRAERIVSGWGAMVAEKLRKLGEYDLDPVHDLARVLRVGWSWNFRHGRRVLPSNGYDLAALARYDVADIEQFVPVGHKPAAVETVLYAVGELVIDAAANPPVEKHEALQVNLPEYRQVWTHKRSLPSGSEQELSLAAYAVQAGWSDQEIANLIIAHRRKYEPEKLAKAMRADYLKATIAKARGDKTRDAALRAMAGDVDAVDKTIDLAPAGSDPAEPIVTPATPSEREVILGKLSAVFGVRVLGWIQFGHERPIYTLILDGDRKIRVGGADAILKNDAAIRRAVYSQTGHVVEPVRGREWRGVCHSLARIAEVEEVHDATEAVQARSGIAAFLAKRGVMPKENRDLACQQGNPFAEEDWLLYVHADTARRWMNIHTANRWENADFLNAIRMLGFRQRTVHYNNRAGSRSTKSYWFIDAKEFPDAMNSGKDEPGG